MIKQAAASVEAMRSAESDGLQGADFGANQSEDAMRSRIDELTRSERMLGSELNVAKDAYDKSRAQYMAAEVEIKMLRSHLDSLKVCTSRLALHVCLRGYCGGWRPFDRLWHGVHACL